MSKYRNWPYLWCLQEPCGVYKNRAVSKRTMRCLQEPYKNQEPAARRIFSIGWRVGLLGSVWLIDVVLGKTGVGEEWRE
jgi:hypothetical protein